LGIRISRAIVRILIVRAYAGSNGRRTKMGMAKKKKGAMIVVAIALVAALAVTGTLMTSKSDSDSITMESQSALGFTVNLLGRGINGHGEVDNNLPASNDVRAFDAIPGEKVPQYIKTYLSKDDDGYGGFVRLKVETTVTLGVIGAIGEDWGEGGEGLEGYYSRLVGMIRTLNDGKCFVPKKSSGEDAGWTSADAGWYFELDPTDEEIEIIDEIIADAVDKDAFYKAKDKEGNLINYENVYDEDDPTKFIGIKPLIAVPESVTLTGYMYYVDTRDGEDGSENQYKDHPILINKWYVNEGYQKGERPEPVEFFMLPKYEKTDDFMEKWTSFKNDDKGFDELITGNAMDQFVTESKSKFTNADKFPLSGAIFALKYQSQAIQADTEDLQSIGTTSAPNNQTKNVYVGKTNTAKSYFAEYYNIVTSDDGNEGGGN
jgi:hypothetical protein